MKPLIITPCPECGNADVSRFQRVSPTLNWRDGAVRCLDCGDTRPVITDDEEE